MKTHYNISLKPDVPAITLGKKLGGCLSGVVLLSLASADASAYTRQIIEAENNYSVSEDYGAYAVEPYNNATQASNDYVALYDVNDMAAITFSVDVYGQYDLGIRVRSGYRSWPVSHWRDAYDVYLDGEKVEPSLDYGSISDLDSVSSGSHWGTMRLDQIDLDAGEHTLEVQTRKAWSLLDYVEIGFDGDISQAPDQQPQAEISASELTGVAPLEIHFNASDSVDDFGIVEYLWGVDGNTVSDGEYYSYTFTDPGEYRLSLQVVDTAGQISTSSVTIQVDEPDIPVPPAPVDPDTGTTTRLEAEDAFTAAADPGAYAIKAYAADQSSGDYLSLYDVGDTARLRFYVAQDGHYSLAARLRSGYKNWPVSHWSGGYSFTLNGQSIAFSGDNDSISNYDSVSSGSHWGTMNSAEHYLTAGYHDLDIQAEKAWGLLDYIEVNGDQSTGGGQDAPPTAIIQASATQGQVPLQTSFDAFNSTDDIAINNYHWDFGDGASGSGDAVTHVYSTAGNYTATLTVTDSSGQTATSEVSIQVEEDVVAPPPTVPPVASGPLTKVTQPMVLDARQHVVLEGLHFIGDAFRNSGRAAIHIIGDSSNIEIRNCLFENIDWAIRIQGGSNIHIHGNRFEKVGMAIRADNTKGGLKIEYNEVQHLGAWDITPYFPGYWGQSFTSIVNSTGQDNSVSYNVIDNEGVPSRYLEDMTNLWNSGGTADSYFQIVGNRYRGSSVSGNVSKTGGGIIVGDGAGSDGAKGWYVTVKDNITVRTQSYGVGGAGGFNLEFLNNKIHLPADHTQILTRHPHHHDQNGGGAGVVFTQYSGNACGNLRFEGNDAHAIGWANGGGVSYPLPKSITDRCSNMVFSNNNWRNSPGPLGDHLLPEDLFSGLSAEYFSANH